MTIKSISKDIVIITTLALCMAIGSYLLSSWLNDQMQNKLVWNEDLWFESDISRIYLIMTDRLNEVHENSYRHPLFSIIAYPTMQALHRHPPTQGTPGGVELHCEEYCQISSPAPA